MASRESYDIKNYWKYPRNKKDRIYPCTIKKFPIDKIRSVLYLIKHKFILGSKYDKRMFWLDNITKPYNKIIGCKLRGHHVWFYMYDEERAFCTKCQKITEIISKDQWERVKKIKRIKKRD